MDNAENIIKSSQEQAVASWVNYLNQVRINQLVAELRSSSSDLAEALKTLDLSLDNIQKLIIERNRGGEKGMHGFIAEIAETGIENAKKIVVGDKPIYEWINDNGPADLLRDNKTEIQQKFVSRGGLFSLNAVKEHLEKYPDFLRRGGKYQIPSDYYEKIKWYMEIPEDVANKLPTSDEFSLSKWKEIHDLLSNDIHMDDLEPSTLDYKSVQKDVISETIDKEKEQLKETSQKRRDTAYEESKPSFSEGAKAAALSAGIESVTEAGLEIARIRKTGKKLSEFDADDWEKVASKGGFGLFKGGVRGSVIYVMTNYTATPAFVASSLTTAGFSVAEQIHEYRTNNLTEVELIENCEIVCLDATVSALSSIIGQVAIPVPVLGAVIGNAVGSVIYSVAKDKFTEKEDEILGKAVAEMQEHSDKVLAEYEINREEITVCVNKYIDLIQTAFDPDIRIAFIGSIELAHKMGVEKDRILDTVEKTDAFFQE